jgi:acyl-coenzyme A synthetase/AMP-(fatty) acid ligase
MFPSGHAKRPRPYLILEETDDKSVFADGYFYRSDVAVRRADGRIRTLGRIDGVLNLQGRKVAEADEVCLFGYLNTAGQEELIVAIYRRHTHQQPSLTRSARNLEAFEFVRFHVRDQFLRTDTGKVRRILLKNLPTKDR